MSKFRFLPHAISLIIFASVIMSSWMVYEHKNKEDKIEKYRVILNNLEQVSLRLQDIIANNALIAGSLAAIIKAKAYQISTLEYNSLVSELMLTREELKNIQFAPNALTEYIYPEQKNADRSRLNIFQRFEKQGILNAVNKHNFYVFGPETVMPGGRGFVISKPLYKVAGNYSELRGIISLAIDLNAVLQKAGLLSHSDEILYAIRTVDDNATYFSGKRVLFELDSIVKRVDLYNFQVEIAAFPQQGWYEEGWTHYIILFVGIVVALFISSLSFLLMKSPVYLQQRINENSLELKNKSRELKIEKQWHESLLDITPDFIFYKDVNGVYITCNQAFADYLGFKKDDIIGKTDEELLPYELSGFFHLIDKAYLESPEYQHNEEWIETNYGKILTLDTIKMPVFDDNDELLGIFGISRDKGELGYPGL